MDSPYPLTSFDPRASLCSLSKPIDIACVVMKSFQNARNFVIQNSSFTEYRVEPQNGSSFRVLYEASLQDAAYDSRTQEIAFDSLPQTCHEGFIEELSPWICGSSQGNNDDTPPAVPKAVLLSGPKSNLPQLIARRLREHLVASFFFSSKNHCPVDNAACLFPTIAYQLAIDFPGYRDILEAELRTDPGLVSKCLEVQFDRLIARPFHRFLTVSGDQVIGNPEKKLILIEALDECESHRDRQEIIRIISHARDDLPFRWLIFSQPDYELEEDLVKKAGFVCLGSENRPVRLICTTTNSCCGVIFRLEKKRRKEDVRIVIVLPLFF